MLDAFIMEFHRTLYKVLIGFLGLGFYNPTREKGASRYTRCLERNSMLEVPSKAITVDDMNPALPYGP